MNNLRSKTRNFCIIAHIDHGKSTLADRILEYTHAIPERELREQTLDSMDIERERGITIKAAAIRVNYTAADGNNYLLNLIDTPGHVDFSYEVARSLGACEGALLLIDASQGVQAQTLANAYLASDRNLVIIPVINKIDLPNARIEEVRQQISDIIGLDPQDSILASAKNGIGVPEILEAIVRRIPPPGGDDAAPLRAVLFDSIYNSFRGAIGYIRVVDGCIKPGQEITAMSSDRSYEVEEVGIFKLEEVPVDKLNAGDVGYVIANMKSIRDIKIGDTLTDASNPAREPLPGVKPVKPMVFCGMYPTEPGGFDTLRSSLEKLSLNDSSFYFEPETSQALGFGFRCGFLGLLHMEIIQERLEREFDLALVTTAPSVVFRVHTTDGGFFDIDNPARLPELSRVAYLEEPYIHATILSPPEYIGTICQLCSSRRGEHIRTHYLGPQKVLVNYDLPLSEVVLDFYDRLKSATRGYASFDYEVSGFRQSDLVKLDVLLNGNPVDALSCIVHKEKAYLRGKQLAEKLRKVIPRQLFEVAIQAAIGNRVIARETIKALRKNVTAKCYGGDITRKRKLLQRQKEGKKRMKQVGNVELPQEAFMAVFEVE
ncbi:MAG: elongation factor 4 [Candidatus Abyssobacteria bacterium SURF_5]|uniref:Elongation factor 4 n=1 Tax=Abyssobacteria bacterium (strain SURF_5) TaxID=2093360 RepID=A0A3A4NNW7_ABYX5|nr:MAG: elongation factor 4 [Candidatus Abyssubacteria bacterium SURF_5]